MRRMVMNAAGPNINWDFDDFEHPENREQPRNPNEIPITCDLDVAHILVDNIANPIEILPSEVIDDSMASRRNIEIEKETEEEEEFEDLISENDKDQQHYDSTSTDDEDFSR
ncbi:hypothetical protein ACP275_07G102000 [Erythranthe tilingii]